MVRSLESRVNAYVNMACDLSTRLFPSDMSSIKGVCGRVEICRKPVTGKSSSRRWPALNERHPDLTITEWFCSNTILTTFFNCNEATKIPRTKILQQIHTDWILSYHSPTPLEFFRRIQPTHRGRAFEKYQKTLRQAINVCKNSEQLKRLKELDGTSDCDADWELWLTEKRVKIIRKEIHSTNKEVHRDRWLLSLLSYWSQGL
ncbi:hypothetical protein BC936DRAFT_142660, partial [Jimgerdemannia flammicorona]